MGGTLPRRDQLWASQSAMSWWYGQLGWRSKRPSVLDLGTTTKGECGSPRVTRCLESGVRTTRAGVFLPSQSELHSVISPLFVLAKLQGWVSRDTRSVLAPKNDRSDVEAPLGRPALDAQLRIGTPGSSHAAAWGS